MPFSLIPRGFYNSVSDLDPQALATKGIRLVLSLIRKKHRIRKNFERHTKQRILSMYVQLLKQDPNTTVRCIATTIFNQMKKES